MLILKSVQTLSYLILSFLQAPEIAVCSWYGEPFHGRQTASGIVYDMDEISCAHKYYPLGTELLMYHAKTQVSVIARVTDRGPFVVGRDVDCSKGLFYKLTKGRLDRGLDDVYIIPIGFDPTGILYPNN